MLAECEIVWYNEKKFGGSFYANCTRTNRNFFQTIRKKQENSSLHLQPRTGNGSAAAAVSGDELHRLQYGYGLQHCRWSGYRPLDAEVGNHWAMLGFGWVKAAESGKAENHYSIVAPDGSLFFDMVKLHPFSYAQEDQFFEKGNALPTCEIDGIRFGCLICYDLRFPEVFSALAPKTDCMLVPANWPERRKLHWCSLLTARAIENQVYVAGINCVGTQDGLHYSGDSRFIAPDGTILQDCRSASGCFVCDLSAKTVAETRQVFPVQKDRRPDFYRSILL